MASSPGGVLGGFGVSLFAGVGNPTVVLPSRGGPFPVYGNRNYGPHAIGSKKFYIVQGFTQIPASNVSSGNAYAYQVFINKQASQTSWVDVTGSKILNTICGVAVSGSIIYLLYLDTSLVVSGALGQDFVIPGNTPVQVNGIAPSPMSLNIARFNAVSETWLSDWIGVGSVVFDTHDVENYGTAGPVGGLTRFDIVAKPNGNIIIAYQGGLETLGPYFNGSSNQGNIASSAPDSGGSGYNIGDLVYVCSTANPPFLGNNAILQITSVLPGGTVLGYTIVDPGGSWYAVGSGIPTQPVPRWTILVNSGGTGYAVGDTGVIQQPGSTNTLIYIVDSIVGGFATGAVQTLSFIGSSGGGYAAATGLATAIGGKQPGAGSGLTVDIDLSGSAGTGLTVEVDTLATNWGRVWTAEYDSTGATVNAPAEIPGQSGVGNQFDFNVAQLLAGKPNRLHVLMEASIFHLSLFIYHIARPNAGAWQTLQVVQAASDEGGPTPSIFQMLPNTCIGFCTAYTDASSTDRLALLFATETHSYGLPNVYFALDQDNPTWASPTVISTLSFSLLIPTLERVISSYYDPVSDLVYVSVTGEGRPGGSPTLPYAAFLTSSSADGTTGWSIPTILFTWNTTIGLYGSGIQILIQNGITYAMAYQFNIAFETTIDLTLNLTHIWIGPFSANTGIVWLRRPRYPGARA